MVESTVQAEVKGMLLTLEKSSTRVWQERLSARAGLSVRRCSARGESAP